MSDKDTKKGIMDEWFNMQNKTFKMWQESLTPKADKNKKPIGETVKSSVDVYNSWYESVSDIYKQNYSKVFGDNDYFSAYNNMLAGANVHSNLKRFYEDLLGKFVDGAQGYGGKNMWQPNSEEFMKTLSDNFVPFLPQPIQKLYKEYVQMQKMLSNGIGGFNQSLSSDAKELQEVMFRSMLGDKQAVYEYAYLMNDNYKKTVEQFMNIPKFGVNNDLFNMEMKNINIFTDYYNTLSQFSEKLTRVGYQSMEAVIEKYKETLKDGAQPKSFEEFYTFWWNLNEEAYKELFKSEDFEAMIEQVNNAGKELKNSYETLIEKQLDQQPFATKKDLESLKETIEELKKELKSTAK